MKRRVQPLMAHDTLRYQYTGNEDTSRMPGDEADDNDIVERLGKIFKDMPPYTPCPVPEYSTAHMSNKVSDCDLCLLSTDWLAVVALTQVVVCRMTSPSMSSTQLPPIDLNMYQRRGRAK
jgi:hypothetical protein